MENKRFLFVFAYRFENQLSPKNSDDWDTIETGTGKLNAAITLSRRLASVTYESIINLGVCGAVTTEIPRLSMHSVDRVIEGDRDIHTQSRSIDLPCLEIPDFMRSHLVTVDQAVTTPVQREHIASKGGMLVDMEAYAVAKTAKAYRTRCHVLKIVLDHADHQVMDQYRKEAPELSRMLCREVSNRLDL